MVEVSFFNSFFFSIIEEGLLPSGYESPIDESFGALTELFNIDTTAPIDLF